MFYPCDNKIYRLVGIASCKRGGKIMVLRKLRVVRVHILIQPLLSCCESSLLCEMDCVEILKAADKFVMGDRFPCIVLLDG